MAELVLNTKTDEHMILYDGIIFNGVLSWSFEKLLKEYPAVSSYILFCGLVFDNKEIAKSIVNRYKQNNPWDNRFDNLLKQLD